MTRPTVIAGLVLMLVVAGVATAGDQGRRLKVCEVTFEGNRAIAADRLLGIMLTRPSHFLARSYYYADVLADDIANVEAFYRQNGYLEARVTDTTVVIDSVAGCAAVGLRIDEGELTRVEGVTIFGNEHFPDSLLRQKIKLEQGDPLRRRIIQEGVLAILSLYAENGYLDASVTPNVQVSDAAHLAVVDYVVGERHQARIAEIRIEGLKKTRPEVVRREFLLREGEIIRYSRLLETQRRLYLTGLFESAFVRPVAAADGDSTTKDILVQVKERPSSEFGVMVGYGSVEKIRGRIELTTTNLAGSARQVGGAVEANFIRQGITASFTEPWTLGMRLRTDVNLYGEFRQEPGYHLRSIGARLAVGKTFGKHTSASLTYRFENTDLTEVEVLAVVKELEPRIRSLELSLARDTRDNLFDAKSGWYFEWTNELAGSFLQGTNTFARSVIVLKAFQPVGREAVLGSALEVGWMDYFGASEEIPLNERFYAGGPTSLRAFGYQMVGPKDNEDNPLGGRFKIIWNLAEMRRTIYKLLGAAAFVDVGNVWSEMGAVHLNDLRVSAGAGIRLASPLGIIRVDYGANVFPEGDEAGGKLFLGMGQAF
ncbi:MAG: outer membrane protein assembly factor BamA [candidate division Zixibacteria bacterium]|nr:outer membrane protein assembly factor BamA [candidate division Zixibacteria bacterium]